MASDIDSNLPVLMGDKGVMLRNMDDADAWARKVIESGNAPKGVTRPAQVLLSVQAGAELGFTPSRSLAAIPVINGRASIMGDAALALVRTSGLLASDLNVEYRGEGEDFGCFVTSQRKGASQPTTHNFTIKKARQAHLWGKDGPWSTYPDRMLYYRALGFHVRDLYGDVLCGLVTFEEVRDYPGPTPRAELLQPTTADPLLVTNGEIIEPGPEPDAEAPGDDEEPIKGELVNPATADEPPDDIDLKEF